MYGDILFTVINPCEYAICSYRGDFILLPSNLSGHCLCILLTVLYIGVDLSPQTESVDPIHVLSMCDMSAAQTIICNRHSQTGSWRQQTLVYVLVFDHTETANPRLHPGKPW